MSKIRYKTFNSYYELKCLKVEGQSLKCLKFEWPIKMSKFKGNRSKMSKLRYNTANMLKLTMLYSND